MPQPTAKTIAAPLVATANPGAVPSPLAATPLSPAAGSAPAPLAMSAAPAVTIEPLPPSDYKQAAEWMSLPNTNKWLTSEWRGRVIDATMIAIACRSRKNQMFVFKHHGTPVGLVGFADVDHHDRTAMIWYLLGDTTTSGKGLTSEAVRQLARHGFDSLGLLSIYAWIMQPNIGSRRVLEKAGFREAGRIRKAAECEGRVVDRVYFDRTTTDP